MAKDKEDPGKLDFATRVKEAIIRKIEGAKDIKRKLDYLMKPEFLETSAVLTESQLQGIAECTWLGKNFKSLEPLSDFARELALWSPSKGGRGRDDAINIFATEKAEGLPLEGLGIHVHGPEMKEGKGKKE